MRLLAWCHISGLHTPIIPPNIIRVVDRWLFTSPCSLAAPGMVSLPDADKSKLGVVSSGIGLPQPPTRSLVQDNAVQVGYVGSLNFSKLHPHYVDFLAAVKYPEFQVTLIGDELNREILSQQCINHNRPNLLRFFGYTTDVTNALSQLDILAYLLNPTHYGTAENVLLEAMSAGVVPVVMNNPAEQAIVEHGVTGMVVDSPASFANAVTWLWTHPQERHAMGQRAALHVQQQFTPTRMFNCMAEHYADALTMSKHPVDMRPALGYEPADWFLSLQADPSPFLQQGATSDNHGLIDNNKGSVLHFHRYFPKDANLSKWAKKGGSHELSPR